MSDAFLVLNAKGKETVRDFLKNLSTQCDEICVAAAFFCKDRLLGDWTAQGCKLRVVVSLTYPTDASVLRALLALPPRQVSVGFYKGQFHSKLYLFLKEGRPIGGVVGSSNFTGGGLERNIETNILINARVELQALSDHFEVIW